MASAKGRPELLAEFIEERRFMPFEWGVNDCALFPADFVLRVTGVDHAHGMRGKYSTERGAARFIARAGGMSGFAKSLNEKDKRFVQRADVVLAIVDERETYGLYVGSGHWCAPGPLGLVFRDVNDIAKAFEY